MEEGLRGRGYGTQFIHHIERIAVEEGYRELYLIVEPWDNPCAFALYQRLGYKQLQAEPYESKWQLTDSDGNLHQGVSWVLDLVKELEQKGKG